MQSKNYFSKIILSAKSTKYSVIWIPNVLKYVYVHVPLGSEIIVPPLSSCVILMILINLLDPPLCKTMDISNTGQIYVKTVHGRYMARGGGGIKYMEKNQELFVTPVNG